MVDYHKELVSTLNKILPTHYEMKLTSKTNVPCISYMELSNYVSTHADKTDYSRISYQVKVWANDIAIAQAYAQEIDIALRPLGWVRISSAELYDNQSAMIQKVLTYEALAVETY